MEKILNSRELHEVYEICLEVTGGISAIVTHEIRNNLAVINENAGLLDDLTDMVGEQGAVPGKKTRQIAAAINGQVAQANKLMKNLNVFAHSYDSPSATIDLQETLNTMIALTRRKALANKSTVAVEGEKGILLHTCPFILESLLYLCLIDMYEISAEDSVIVTKIIRDNNVVRLQLSHSERGASVINSKVDLLSRAIQAELFEEDGVLTIKFEM